MRRIRDVLLPQLGSSQRIVRSSLNLPVSLLNLISRQTAPSTESKNSRPKWFSANLRLAASVGTLMLVILIGAGAKAVRTPNVIPTASRTKPASAMRALRARAALPSALRRRVPKTRRRRRNVPGAMFMTAFRGGGTHF